MERRAYQLTEREQAKAELNEVRWSAALVEIETHAADKPYWKRRRTTYGLAKRDASRQLLKGSTDYYQGRGQGLIDQMCGLPYGEERLSSAYNMGYHDGYTYDLRNSREMVDYIAANPNFAFYREEQTNAA